MRDKAGFISAIFGLLIAVILIIWIANIWRDQIYRIERNQTLSTTEDVLLADIDDLEQNWSTKQWQTFTDAKYGFELRHPTSFKLTENTDQKKLFKSDIGHFWVTVEDNIDNLDAKQIKEDFYKNDTYGYQYEDSFVNVAGREAYRQGRYDLGIAERYYIPAGEQIYILSFEFNFDTGVDSEEYRYIISAIIDSLKLK